MLVLAIVYEGVAIPIYWIYLDKKGNSNQSERIALMKRFKDNFGLNCINCVVGDREFVGKKGLAISPKNKILFRMRIRQNFKVVSVLSFSQNRDDDV